MDRATAGRALPLPRLPAAQLLLPLLPAALLLGAGGMGQVWRAVDERLGRQVAVKVLARPEDKDLVLRLDSEARAAAALSDPHMVAVHDIGEAPVDGSRVVYLVMELVEGRPLGQSSWTATRCATNTTSTSPLVTP